jgi:hypothetical protein
LRRLSARSAREVSKNYTMKSITFTATGDIKRAESNLVEIGERYD